MDYTVRKKGSPTGACKKQELKQFNVEKKIQFDGFYLTHGHYSSGATFHDAKLAKIIAYSQRPTNVICLSSLANNA